MNAAARVIHQGNVFTGQLSTMQMTKTIYFLSVLMFAVLLSALGVVYSTNSYRVTLSLVEQEEQQAHLLQLQWGQLLLEQSSLATPARVESMARQQLNMVFPVSDKILSLQAR